MLTTQNANFGFSLCFICDVATEKVGDKFLNACGIVSILLLTFEVLKFVLRMRRKRVRIRRISPVLSA